MIAALIILAAVFSGCTTGQISVKSEPSQAKVRALEPTTGEGYSLGVTPFLVDRPDPGLFLGDLILIEVAKEGYQTQRFWLPNTPRFNRLSNTELNVKMAPLQPMVAPELIKKAWNSAVEKIIESQRFVGERNYAQAEISAHEAMETVGEFPAAQRLIGSLHYLKGEFKKSLEVWRKILQENPKDKEAAKMVKLIRGQGQ